MRRVGGPVDSRGTRGSRTANGSRSGPFAGERRQRHPAAPAPVVSTDDLYLTASTGSGPTGLVSVALA